MGIEVKFTDRPGHTGLAFAFTGEAGLAVDISLVSCLQELLAAERTVPVALTLSVAEQRVLRTALGLHWAQLGRAAQELAAKREAEERVQLGRDERLKKIEYEEKLTNPPKVPDWGGTITIKPASSMGAQHCNLAGCRGTCGICTPPKAKTPRPRKAAVKKR